MKNWKTYTEKADEEKGTPEQRFLVLPKIDLEEHEMPSTAYGVSVEHDDDGRPLKVELGARRVPFDRPGKRVEAKRLYTVKAVKADGTLVQVPYEEQINNQKASPQDALGLRVYQRRGQHMLFDFETHKGAYCPTWGCWAEWNDDFDGFCCNEHRAITKPRDAVTGSPFEQNATTSATWQ